MFEYLVVMTTLGDAQQAVELARALLLRRLVACVNIVPGVRSLYHWKGELAEDTEQMLVMKTRAERYQELAAAVSELHPYEVPELIAVSLDDGAPAYLAWIDDCLKPDSGDRSG